VAGGERFATSGSHGEFLAHIPEVHRLAVGADRGSMVSTRSLDMQNGSLAVTHIFTHADIDQKEQAVPLKHFPRVAPLSVLEEGVLMLMALHKVSDTEGAGIFGQQLFIG